jgi:hypothetical protein
VLKHLELGERRAELLACPEMLGAKVEQCFHRARGLGAQRGCGTVDSGFKQGERSARRADDRVGTGLDAVESTCAARRPSSVAKGWTWTPRAFASTAKIVRPCG